MKNIVLSVLKILDKQSKKQAFSVLFVAVLFGIIELIGIGSLFLFMQVVVLETPAEFPKYLQSVYYGLNFSNYNLFILFIGGFTLFTMFFRSVVFLLHTYLQTNFVGSLQVKLSTRLFSNYVNQNIEFFITNTTSRLTKNVIQEIPRLCGNTVFSLIEIASNLITLSIILIFLFINEPVLVTIGSFILLVFYATIYRLLRGYINKKGTERVELSEYFFTSVQQSLLGVREIKLYDAFKQVFTKIETSALKQKHIFVFFRLFQQMPRQFLELIVATIIIGYILMAYDTGSSKEIIPQLTFLAVSIYRLMPKFDSIMASFMKIKFDHNIFEILEQHLELNSEHTKSKKQITWDNDIEIKGIAYSYPKSSERIALGPISFKIKKGEMLGIQGESGSGKSTFLEILCSLLPFKDGAILVDGMPINSESESLNIAYIPQDPRFFEGSLLENIAFGIPTENIDRSKAKEAAITAGIHDFIEELEESYDHILGENAENLSGGQKQRIALARAIYKNSDLLILDEATNSLDKKTERDFIKNLNQLKGKRTIIIISHTSDCYKYCDRTITFKDGKISP